MCPLRVFLVLLSHSHCLTLILTDWVTNASSIYVYLGWHSTRPRSNHHDMLFGPLLLMWWWPFSTVQHVGMVYPSVRFIRAYPIGKLGNLPYLGCSIHSMLHYPPPGLPSMLWSKQIWSVPSFKESIPLDPSSNPVTPVFLQLSLIFFNQHNRCRLHLPGWLPLHVLFPHSNLRVVWLNHPVA
jgi:hypothetical protein